MESYKQFKYFKKACTYILLFKIYIYLNARIINMQNKFIEK